MSRGPDRRAVLLGVIALVGIAGVLLSGPLRQDPAYHAFSDQREILGVPNFWNVVSNVPFAIAGILGLFVLARRPRGMIAENALAYLLFFAGAIVIAVGSAYYHLNPTDGSLLWDRLPMTISLMAFFDLVIGEHIGARLARRALLPLVAVGIASAAWWGLSEDLRPYAIVQFLPMVLIPLILILYPSRLSGVSLLWSVLACYALAKVFELFDAGDSIADDQSSSGNRAQFSLKPTGLVGSR